MKHGTVSAKFDADEALVLFDMLSRWSNDGAPLQVNDPGEEVALDGLLAQLDKQLVAPFDADYKQQLAQALSVLRQRGGAI